MFTKPDTFRSVLDLAISFISDFAGKTIRHKWARAAITRSLVRMQRGEITPAIAAEHIRHIAAIS